MISIIESLIYNNSAAENAIRKPIRPLSPMPNQTPTDVHNRTKSIKTGSIVRDGSSGTGYPKKTH
jgi:hypothetical protein